MKNLKVYEDNFGRCIWLTVNPSEIKLDLQDLNPNYEYERCATVLKVGAVCEALKIHYDDLETQLYMMLKDQMTAFDLFTEFLDDHQIFFEYYSG